MWFTWKKHRLSGPEEQLVVNDDFKWEYTGYIVEEREDGFVTTWFHERIAGPFDTLSEAKGYCEVCYRMGVHK